MLKIITSQKDNKHNHNHNNNKSNNFVKSKPLKTAEIIVKFYFISAFNNY